MAVGPDWRVSQIPIFSDGTGSSFNQSGTDGTWGISSPQWELRNNNNTLQRHQAGPTVVSLAKLSQLHSCYYTVPDALSVTPVNYLEFVHLPTSLMRWTWQLASVPVVVITPDELDNVLESWHRVRVHARPHSSGPNWKLYNVRFAFTALTIKSAGPFYSNRCCLFVALCL